MMENKGTSKLQVVLSTAFMIIFLVILIIPAIVERLHPNPAASTETGEKRALKERPAFSFSKEFAREYQDYYNDHFGLREQLIHAGSKYKITLFHTPMNPVKVLFGKHDMLFYNNADGQDRIFGSYTHTNLLTPEALSAQVSIWEKRTAELGDRGIRYITGFWPSPQTIYPEWLPLSMKLQIRDTFSKADQIINYLKARHSPVRFVDVRNDLNKAKKDYPLYHKHDTHWNGLGAFTGYQGLISQCQDLLHLKPLTLQDFELTWADDRDGDLYDMLGIPQAEGNHGKAPVLRLLKDAGRFVMLSAKGDPPRSKHTACKNCDSHLRLLVFGDSYTTALQQFYSSQFREVIYIRSGYDQAMVDKVRPDIVIDIPAERYL